MNKNSLATLSKTEFVEIYHPILIPIESHVAAFYLNNPTAYDFDVLIIYECILKDIKAKLTQFLPPTHKLEGVLKELYELLVKSIDESNQMTKFTLEEIQACLKLLQKSVKLWSREHGSRGYLNFIVNYV